MKFTIATNWDDALIGKIKHKDIIEIYGKLNSDIVGGPRPAWLLPKVTREKAEQHIRKAHECGLEFNYLLNSVSMDNQEFTIAGQKKLRRLLDWLSSVGVDSLTISMPYLVNFVKKNYPRFKIHISFGGYVVTAKAARYWEEMGADVITLPATIVNRDFKLIRYIREAVRCKLQLIANNGCLDHCPYAICHGISGSHSSQSGHRSRGFNVDYYFTLCRYRHITNPMDLIRSDWIRPEDVQHYEKIGIDRIKLVDRMSDTATLARIAVAYVNNRYDGNLLDLLPLMHKRDLTKRQALSAFRPFQFNIFKVKNIARLFSTLPASVDNKKLDGFLDYFIREGCDGKSCEECSYCADIAKKAVTIIDENKYNEFVHLGKEILNDLETGSMFTYIK